MRCYGQSPNRANTHLDHSVQRITSPCAVADSTAASQRVTLEQKFIHEKSSRSLTPNHRNRKKFNPKNSSCHVLCRQSANRNKNGEAVSAKSANAGATPCATASNSDTTRRRQALERNDPVEANSSQYRPLISLLHRLWCNYFFLKEGIENRLVFRATIEPV
jgi:hypothetical protein